MAEAPAGRLRLADVQSYDDLTRLTRARRRVFFRAFLVEPAVIVVSDADPANYLGHRVAASQVMRQQRSMGHHHVGRQLVQEANEVYYGENEFRVQLEFLGDFMRNAGGDEEPPEPTAPLVRKRLTIEMELHDIWHSAEIAGLFGGDDYDAVDYDEEENADVVRWTRGRLRYAQRFVNVESMHLVLLGAGLVDGSDLATHQTVKEIASLVRKLIVQFGDRFDITKRLTRGDNLEQSLKGYWDAPSDEARQRVREGRATTEELMRVEIARWLDEDKREPGPDGEWDRLV